MKILKEHFEYNNGTYSLVKLENYQCIEKWEQNSRQVEIKPKENEENKVTSIWLVIYQAGTLLTNDGKTLTQKEFDDFFKDFGNIQVDIERTFLAPFIFKNETLPRGYMITPFYKDGVKRRAEIEFNEDDFDSLRKL